MLIYCIQRNLDFGLFGWYWYGYGLVGAGYIDRQTDFSKTVLGMTKLDSSFETEFEMIEIVLFQILNFVFVGALGGPEVGRR